MLTRTGIRALCNTTAYRRGLDIYHGEDRVVEFRVQETEEEDLIQAYVKGRGSMQYSVRVKYNKRLDNLEKIFCECPEFQTQAGICKHCVAVLLKYVEHENRKQAALEREKKKAEEEKKVDTEDALQRFLPPDRLSQGGRQTTASMKLLMDRQHRRRLSPLLDQEVFGKVQLVPYLRCTGAILEVEFVIGVSRMYVLKDIYEFVGNMNRNREFTYGQKLRFLHTRQAFAPDSVEMVNFVINWARRNESMYAQYSVDGTREYAKVRALPIKGEDLEELLIAADGRTITAQVGREGERDWLIAEGWPKLTLTFTGSLDGMEVQMGDCCSVNGNRYRIFFSEGTVYLVSKTEGDPAEKFIDCLEGLPEKKAYIQRRDIPLFGREFLPHLEKKFNCVKKNFDEQRYGILNASYEVYLDAPEKDWITCKAFAVYGEKKFSVFQESADPQEQGIRDLAGELEIRELLSRFFNTYDEEKTELILTNDEDKMYSLFNKGVTVIQEFAAVFITDSLKKIGIMEPPKVKIGVSLSGDLLDLDIAAEGMEREELMELLSKYNRKKKFYRLKNGSFLSLEDDQVEALFDLKEGLHLTSRQLKQEKIQVPAYRALFLDTKLRDARELKAVKNEEFRSLIRNMRSTAEQSFEVPKEQKNILRKYQKQGFLWLKILKRNGFGGILADDMGLGKTLQIITFLWSEYQERKREKKSKNHFALIVTPSSLVFNWASEMEQFAPKLPVRIIVGNVQEREELIKNAEQNEVLVTSYELLRRDIKHYEKMKFSCQIIDEAQYIKNHTTQAAKTVKTVNAGFKAALTGTPVENRLSELWSIFDYLMPGFLYHYEQFRKELEQPIVQDGDEKAMERLQAMIRPFVLRRMKKDVLKDLPEKLEKDMFARMEGEQQNLYDAHVKQLQMTLGKQSDQEFKTSKIRILAEITKLRQICCHPELLYEDYHEGSAKMDMCLELIRNAVGGGHKILLFSQFTSMLDLLLQELSRQEISYYVLTGATPKEERARLVAEFNRDATSVFAISLKAGGTGLNLTSADIVIHYDPWWNLAVQNQATDRAHRIGQKNVVSVYRLFAKGTIEEKIKKLQEKKMELADEILSGEGIDSGRMSREEMIELLEL